ncbi:MAG: hypothetical protein V4547_18065 [Bacteroidota bacterium]
MADLSHNQKLSFFFSALAAAGGVISVLMYIENQKIKKISDENVFLERQIKGLDLVYKQQRNAQANLAQV